MVQRSVRCGKVHLRRGSRGEEALKERRPHLLHCPIVVDLQATQRLSWQHHNIKA